MDVRGAWQGVSPQRRVAFSRQDSELLSQQSKCRDRRENASAAGSQSCPPLVAAPRASVPSRASCEFLF